MATANSRLLMQLNGPLWRLCNLKVGQTSGNGLKEVYCKHKPRNHTH